MIKLTPKFLTEQIQELVEQLDKFRTQHDIMLETGKANSMLVKELMK